MSVSFRLVRTVGKQCQEFVPDIMPEIVDALRATQKTRAIHDVGAPFENRCEQLLIIPRIIFEIGVLHQDDVAARLCKTPAQGCTFPAIPILKQEADFLQSKSSSTVLDGDLTLTRGLGLFKCLQQGACAVCGTIIDDENFLLERGSLNARQHLFYEGVFVVDRNYDRELHACFGPSLPEN